MRRFDRSIRPAGEKDSIDFSSVHVFTHGRPQPAQRRTKGRCRPAKSVQCRPFMAELASGPRLYTAAYSRTETALILAFAIVCYHDDSMEHKPWGKSSSVTL